MKVCLILPYFGKLPNYFDFYLKSASLNPEITWFLITDDRSDFNYPPNFRVVYQSYEELKNQIITKFGVGVRLDRPHKLCDFKPAFGDIFSEYLQEFDYWGHCDPDIIWGRFSNFLNWEVLKQYDKIFIFGHLSLYRNTKENNIRYRHLIDGVERYMKVFQTPITILFDEKYDNSINTIFENNHYPLFKENYAADINAYYCEYRLSEYDERTNSFSVSKEKVVFTWEEGHIYGYHLHGKNLVKKEYLYIHLIKRPMENVPDTKGKIVFFNHSFEELNEEITINNFQKYYHIPFFNRQFYRIKWKSLMYRIKYRNDLKAWKHENV